MLFSTFRLPVSGIHLGNGDTDTIIGTVNPALADSSDEFLRVTSVGHPVGIFTYNLEGTIATYTDESALMTVEDYLVNPFGTATTMDAGDAIFIRPYLTTAATSYSRIYFDITTPGVGSYAIAVRRFNESTETFDLQTITADTTSAFTVGGVGYVEFTSNTHGSTRLQQQDASKHFWTKIEIATLTSVTTAPVIASIWFKTSGSGVNLFNTTVSDSLTIRASTSFIAGDAYYLAVDDTVPIGWNVVSKAADDIPVSYRWEYLNSSGNWSALVILRDETNGFTSAVTNAAIRWLLPSDWTSMTLSLMSDTTGTTSTRTGFIHRMLPVDSNLAIVQTTGAAVIRYVRLGASRSDGIPLTAGTLDYITYDIFGATSATNVSLGFVNSTTGKMSITTISANRRSSLEDPGNKRNLLDLVFNADDQFMLFHLAGGNLTDIELRLHTL